MLKSVIKLIIVVGLITTSFILLDKRVFIGVFLFAMADNIGRYNNKGK